MPTVLITGANRGLGLEFCRQYAENNWQVLACCRTPNQASQLQQLAQHYPQIQVHELDVADFGQIDKLAAQLHNMPIDVLLNNAGIYGDDNRHRFWPFRLYGMVADPAGEQPGSSENGRGIFTPSPC